MRTKDFYYDLPPELIAQRPLEKRDASRLFIYDRNTGAVRHGVFTDLIGYLSPGDAVVLNNTRVIPARLYGTKEASAVRVEVLLLRRTGQDTWEALCRPGRKLKAGSTVRFDARTSASVIEKRKDGVALLRFSYDGLFEHVLERLGNVPLPPYIREILADGNRYQTVYAHKDGSAAAPTAGLHFTEECLQRLREKGVSVLSVLLHVGLGTFRPVKTEQTEDHIMHAEYYEVDGETAGHYNEVKRRGGRILAVGTSTVRTLETVSGETGLIRPASGDTSLFITPGYRFKTVDRLLTNFHLPESTLLMLVGAFAGHEQTMRLYREAVEKRYRFFSFGDAMLIL